MGAITVEDAGDSLCARSKDPNLSENSAPIAQETELPEYQVMRHFR